MILQVVNFLELVSEVMAVVPISSSTRAGTIGSKGSNGSSCSRRFAPFILDGLNPGRLDVWTLDLVCSWDDDFEVPAQRGKVPGVKS